MRKIQNELGQLLLPDLVAVWTAEESHGAYLLQPGRVS